MIKDIDNFKPWPMDMEATGEDLNKENNGSGISEDRSAEAEG